VGAARTSAKLRLAERPRPLPADLVRPSHERLWIARGDLPISPIGMKQRKVLIIADERSEIRSGASRWLGMAGYSAVFAAPGVTAIRMARKERPQVILLDLVAPVRNGFSVLERLQINTELSHLPVIVLCEGDSEADEERALKSGACAYLQKPVDDADLLDAISAALR
jgi:DNA-binding response OmpR family regulator